MRGDYTELIEKVSAEIAERVLEQETGDSPREAIWGLDGAVLGLLRSIGLRVMARVLEALQDQLVEQSLSAGYRVQRFSEIRYSVIFGVLMLSSVYLWKPGGGRRPLRELGVSHQGRSLTVERALASLGSEESFRQAAERFEEHYGWAVDKSTVWRVTGVAAQEAERYRQQELETPLPERAGLPSAEELLLELDGCEIRTGTLEPIPETVTSEKPKKRRITQWREVRLGLARPLGAVSKQYVGGMLDYPSIVSQLRTTAVRLGMTDHTQMVAVADGGQGLKEELESQFYPLQFILDRPHLQSHLYETAEALGLAATQQSHWVAEQMTAIDQGAVASVIGRLREDQQTQPLERRKRLIGYLERFQDCVHYDAFREKGWPIGSGEVESAHRYIPQKRLKLPGAWWLPESVNPMLSLRLIRANGGWEGFWQQKQRTCLAAFQLS